MLVQVHGDAAPADKSCREWFRRTYMVRRSCSVPGGTKSVLFTIELLKPSAPITGDRYRLQLIRLSRALREKRPQYEQRHDKVILLHNNARPHVAKVVKKIFGNAQMKCFTAPAVFSGHCAF